VCECVSREVERDRKIEIDKGRESVGSTSWGCERKRKVWEVQGERYRR